MHCIDTLWHINVSIKVKSKYINYLHDLYTHVENEFKLTCESLCVMWEWFKLPPYKCKEIYIHKDKCKWFNTYMNVYTTYTYKWQHWHRPS